MKKLDVVKLRPDRDEITLTCYVADDAGHRVPRRQAVIVFPGGGYDHLSWREAEPVAMKFYAQGMNAFVVAYSILENALFPTPLVDASLAVAYVRSHADEFNIDPDQIYVIGFSAGGHMVSMIGTMWHHEEAKISPDMPYGLNKPNGMIVCYGVTSIGDYENEGTTELLSGTPKPNAEQIDRISTYANVDENTVPAFIWHCSDDWCVPVQNAFMLARRMADYGRPFELKIYRKGPHGIATANRYTSEGHKHLENPYIRRWPEDVIRWIEDRYPEEEATKA